MGCIWGAAHLPSPQAHTCAALPRRRLPSPAPRNPPSSGGAQGGSPRSPHPHRRAGGRLTGAGGSLRPRVAQQQHGQGGPAAGSRGSPHAGRRGGASMAGVEEEERRRGWGRRGGGRFVFFLCRSTAGLVPPLHGGGQLPAAPVPVPATFGHERRPLRLRHRRPGPRLRPGGEAGPGPASGLRPRPGPAAVAPPFPSGGTGGTAWDPGVASSCARGGVGWR